MTDENIHKLYLEERELRQSIERAYCLEREQREDRRGILLLLFFLTVSFCIAWFGLKLLGFTLAEILAISCLFVAVFLFVFSAIILLILLQLKINETA